MNLFNGLMAFPLTPTDDEGSLNCDLLAVFLERIVAGGADCIGLLGSTGGYAYLTRKERKRALRVAVECVGAQTPLIVGVGALRTDMAEDLARDANKAGANGLLLAPASYLPLTDEEVFRHFEAVAAAGDLPICIYNNPTTTRFDFSKDLIARLAKIPNVVAAKMPLPAGDDYVGNLRNLQAATPAGFSIGYSGDWGAKDALLAGGACWYSVIAGLLPEYALALTRPAQNGELAEAERINLAFEPLWKLFREFGSFRAMYTLVELLGLGRVSPPRPILPLSEANRGRLATALTHLHVALEK
ncbi:dihydrodipicolinate synthase family protein [Marinicauda pacifica]|uniref:dihydrodipicolinate synthase family protein n=1 Tax=Marinicauda pacifica TaxID=1133559 RepID=UPI0035C7B59C